MESAGKHKAVITATGGIPINAARVTLIVGAGLPANGPGAIARNWAPLPRYFGVGLITAFRLGAEWCQKNPYRLTVLQVAAGPDRGSCIPVS